MDGVTDFIQGNGYFSSPVYSVSLWFKRNGNPLGTTNGYHILLTHPSGDTYGQGLLLQANGSRALFQLRDTNNVTQSLSADAPAADNTPHHYAVTCSATEMRLYLDGVLVGTKTIIGAKTGTTPFVIGRSSAGVYQANGIVREVKVWDAEISGAEVLAEFNQGPSVTLSYQSTPVPVDATINDVVNPSPSQTSYPLGATFKIQVPTLVSDEAYTLTVMPATGGGCNLPPGAYQYAPNTLVTVTAIPDSGYQLQEWLVTEG
jgi:hypothetical protein